jgi:hypothetical protein
MTIRYTINGAKFRRTYSRREWRAMITRARVLRENGISVVIRR